MTYHDHDNMYGPEKISAHPVDDRRGKVWIARTDSRNTDDGGWQNVGVTRRPRDVHHNRERRRGKAVPQQDSSTRKVRHSLDDRRKQHSAHPCRDSGDEMHSSDRTSILPGSVNPRK